MAGPWERFARPQQAAPQQADGPWTKFGAGLTPAQQTAQQPPAEPEMSWAETGADVAKSAGIGLVQGAIGIGTLPGNIEQLGRLGINKGAEMLGYEPPVSNESWAPNYGDVKGLIEQQTSEFYKPQSTAGEYARTIGEFAPMALGGAGAVGKALNVVAPALMSETAGQLTEGTEAEPYARIAGAFAGGVVPRVITPLPADAIRRGHIGTLEKEGVTALTAGQRTGSAPLRWTESVAKDTPWGGGKAMKMETQAAEQYTAAILKRAGIKADRATPEVLDQAFTDLGRKFEHLGNSTVMRVDRKLSDDMSKAIGDYNDLVPEAMRAPIIAKGAHDLMMQANANGGRLPGTAYQAFRSRLETMRRASANDPQKAKAFGDMRDALDDAMERSMPTPRAKQWGEVRREYKNLLTIEKAATGAGENAANGLISAAQLRAAAKQQGKRAYTRGKDDFGELARAGEAVLKPLPQSGTAPRAAASALLGIGGTAFSGGNVLAGLAAAAAEPALRAALARSIMSKPVQNALANQRMTGYMAERPAMAVNALLAPQIAAEHGGLVGRQTTGPYPPWQDPRWLD